MLKFFGDGLSLTMRRKITFFGLGLGVGILLVCVIFNALGGTLSVIKERLCATDAAQARADRFVNVEAMPVGVGTMTKRVTAVGKTKASESVVIKSEIHARLKEILFTEGGTVTKDQEIIRFEDADMQAELQDAEAQLALAQANFDRTSKLHEQKFGSAKEFDKDKGQLDVATARVAIAKAKLEKTVIKAPFTGHIGLINISVGTFVQSNTELVTLVQTNPMKIDFKVAEKFVHDVGVGQSAEVTIDAFKGRIFLASVEAVDSNVDSDSHSLALRATTDNDNNELMAGLFANVSLIIGERGNTIMVDEAAVLREGTIEFVWVVQKGKARKKAVKTGVHEKNMIEIVTGVGEGEIVVISGHTRLQDGVRVKVMNDKDEIERVAKEKAGKATAAEAATLKPEKEAKVDA
ncbi:MAG: efflux RND transporter periplasmic adaptor subunit, partial [Pseudomonadota bacterium]